MADSNLFILSGVVLQAGTQPQVPDKLPVSLAHNANHLSQRANVHTGHAQHPKNNIYSHEIVETWRHELVKKQVTQKDLMALINRHLVFRGEILKKCAKSSWWHKSLGDYFLVDVQSDSVIDTNTNLEKLARKTGALNNSEELELVA